jgi:hypothetical protein
VLERIAVRPDGVAEALVPTVAEPDPNQHPHPRDVHRQRGDEQQECSDEWDGVQGRAHPRGH